MITERAKSSVAIDVLFNIAPSSLKIQTATKAVAKKIPSARIFGVAKEQSSWQDLRRNSAQKQILREEFLRMFLALKKRRSSAILGGKTLAKLS
jgi:hypothetical protein